MRRRDGSDTGFPGALAGSSGASPAGSPNAGGSGSTFSGSSARCTNDGKCQRDVCSFVDVTKNDTKK